MQYFLCYLDCDNVTVTRKETGFEGDQDSISVWRIAERRKTCLIESVTVTLLNCYFTQNNKEEEKVQCERNLMRLCCVDFS